MMTASIKFPLKRNVKITFQNSMLLLLLLSYILGFCIATALFVQSDGGIAEFSQWLLNSALSLKRDTSFRYCFFVSFLRELPIVVAIYFFGICALGCVATPIAIVLKGAADAFKIACIYKTYGIDGMGFNALVFAPGTVFFAFVVLLSARESFCLSTLFLKNILPGEYAVNMFKNFKTYTVRFTFIIVLALVAALVDTIFAALFLNFFDF